MTRLKVNAGICGFTATVTAKMQPDKSIRVALDTDCEMVAKMSGDIASLDRRAAFTGLLNNPVYRSAAVHLKHVACPVPSAILKALEVESGLCLRKDVAMTFEQEEN